MFEIWSSLTGKKLHLKDGFEHRAMFLTQNVNWFPLKLLNNLVTEVGWLLRLLETSGSNDAIPPEFPRQELGSGDDSGPDAAVLKHKEGIYSKRAAPREAWAERQTAAQDGVQESAKTRNSLESVQATHSVFGSAHFYLHPPVPLDHEPDFLARREAFEQSTETERPVPPSRDFFQHKGTWENRQPPFSLHHPTEEQRFSALIAEPDYSLVQLTPIETGERGAPRNEADPDARKAGHQVAKDLPLPGSQTTCLKARKTAGLPQMQTVHFTNSLDELWSKYLERRQQQQLRYPGSNRNELSLVERLDRLARLLQNPVQYSLMPEVDEQNNVQEKEGRREPKKARFQGKTQGEKSYPASQVRESHGTTSKSTLSESRRQKAGSTKTGGPLHRISEQSPNSETPSDTSSEARPGKGSSALTDLSTSESDVATQDETAPPTEASGSISSIDTARLVRAFGHNRVRASPRLSQLYSTISLQRSRSEKQAKGSRRALATDPSKIARSEHKRKDAQPTCPISSSDSVSTPGSSRGPSSALSHKQTTRMLNKAVQAGDFEIVNSATKKHTRDVGLTFPTPTSSQTKLRGDRWNEDELTRPDGLFCGSQGKPKRQPSGLLAEKRPARHKLKWLQGVSWFVPAEDLKSDPQKEPGPGVILDPGPSWFEPLSSTKPWREPLREKNWSEEPGGLQVRLTAPARDVENEPPPPYAKLSLQEALVLRRPDFISSSGERVKRLKLIVQERKLQSILQSEREQLFNPREERRAYRNGASLVSSRGTKG
uniref:Uncharacterized protein n=1 Tax=Sphaerodactylus townsendi TaxID=933632 RepID=A0ACB8E9G6_9SAUR